jgi:phosphatidate cytidylyltransferase
MLKEKKLLLSRAEAAVLGALGPAAVTVQVSFLGGDGALAFSIALILGASWVLVSRIFPPRDGFEDTLHTAAAGFSVMLYPGFFMAWIILLALFPRADRVILVFLLMVIASDSAAWAMGMLFGKGNRGIIPASPNKSAAGFLGGFVSATLVGLGAALLDPQSFSSSRVPSLPGGVILGMASGTAAILGDLAESVLKRSSNIKDSGSIIPGRGGVLDSIDSIALAAPVYYGLYRLFFG